MLHVKQLLLMHSSSRGLCCSLFLLINTNLCGFNTKTGTHCSDGEILVDAEEGVLRIDADACHSEVEHRDDALVLVLDLPVPVWAKAYPKYRLLNKSEYRHC